MQNQVRDTANVEGGKGLRGEGISWRRLPLAMLLAALGAAVVNAVVYSAASRIGFIPENLPVPTPGGEQPLTVVSVVIGSVIGAIGAAIAFAVIGLVARRPVRQFRIFSVGVLVLSFAGPPATSGAPLSMVLSLEAMHVAAWAVIVGLLTLLARRDDLAGE